MTTLGSHKTEPKVLQTLERSKDPKANQIEKGYPQHPFRLFITGPSQVGKSTLAFKLLSEIYAGKFDELHIFSPTVFLDPIYNCLVDPESKDRLPEYMIHDTYSPQDVEDIKKRIDESKKKKRALIVFDDFQSFPNLSPFTSASDSTLLSLRHHNCSAILISQDYKDIHPKSRNNLSHLCILRQANLGEIKKIADEQCGLLSQKNFIKWLVDIFDNDEYGYAYIDLTVNPKLRHRVGINGELASYGSIAKQLGI